jgi:peptidoglycan/xylan/chitin deacetylase (PgdA/CDA1 family)
MVTNAQANTVLVTMTVALGSLLIAVLVLLGLSIFCHPLWVVRWTQKLQPHVLYLKPIQEKIVALTLDDGPHAHITPQLLDILRENDCKATWFVIGNHMEPCPEIVERILAEGHEVANHMMDDVASWTLSKRKFEAQLVECDNRLKNFFHYNSSGQPLKWFRPGHGFYNPQILQTCKEHGYRIALGSLYPMDHMFVKQAKLLAQNMLWRIHPGAIIILHDRVPQYAQTPEVLRLLLPELKKRGYKIVTLSELDGFMGNTELKTHSD